MNQTRTIRLTKLCLTIITAVLAVPPRLSVAAG
jgi:hypothetical protein